MEPLKARRESERLWGGRVVRTRLGTRHGSRLSKGTAHGIRSGGGGLTAKVSVGTSATDGGCGYTDTVSVSNGTSVTDTFAQAPAALAPRSSDVFIGAARL